MFAVGCVTVCCQWPYIWASQSGGSLLCAPGDVFLRIPTHGGLVQLPQPASAVHHGAATVVQGGGTQCSAQA